MPTLRRRNLDPVAGSRTPLRSSLADAAWAVEDRVVWGAADAFRDIVDLVQEETALWSQALRAAVLAGLIVLAAAGVAAGVIVSDPTGGGGEQPGPNIRRVSAPGTVPPTTPSAKAAEAAGGPVLQGTGPDFAPTEQGGGVSKAEAATEPPASQVAGGAESAAGVAEKPTAETATTGGPGSDVAGPEAIAVARRFAGAFVLYETGIDNARVREIFHATATPDLAKALLKRPPRLPANVKVPEAKVLNIVAGPKHGDSYTLSVSLLRVGVTSELRLDMGKTTKSDKPVWLVTDVLG